MLLNRADGPGGATAITDDEGRFTFANLPSGRYLLGVHKPGFVRMNYGETRPGRPGSAIVVASGQPVTDLTLRISPGAVITGAVVDPAGAPASDVEVYVFASRMRSGQRHLEELKTVMTDDRGVYRIFGLAPGTYVVAATTRFRFGSGAARETTAADVQRALGTGTKPAATEPRRASVGFAAVYYPGTVDSAAASAITLAAGQERAGVDFMLQLIPLSSVTGRLTWPGVRGRNEPAHVIMVPLAQSPWLHGMEFDSAVGDDLTFRFPHVAPGRYAIVAQTATVRPDAEGAAAAAAEAEPLSAVHEIDVHGADVENIVLALQPGASVSGRIVVPRAASIDVGSVSLELRPPTTRPVAMRPPHIRVNPDGTFEIGGITPGAYRLFVRSRPEGGIPVSSVMVNGVNALDDPVDFRSGVRVDDAVVTFTESPTELSGVMQDASGRPAPEHFIVVFSPQRNRWFRDSRYIQAVRPATDGRYVIRGLPSGEYLIAALTDVEEDEWFDPSFLEQLLPSAIKISLREGEKKIQDFRIGR